MSSAAVELHPEVKAEAREARLWYAERDPTAAEAFVAALDHAIALAAEGPARWPRYLHGTQRVLTRRYPFAVIYRASPERALVVAVAHQKRRPGYWRSR